MKDGMTLDIEQQTQRSARKVAFVFLGILVAAVSLVVAWLVPEAMRIRRERDQREMERRLGSEMVRVPSGSATMGATDGAPEEQPLHDVRVSDFWMDQTEVTNAQFTRFVEATKYVTTAEKSGGSWCFRPDAQSTTERKTWAKRVPGANWRQPDGAGSEIGGRGKFPAVHISHDDAMAYCKWANKRLPTEAEWEFAAHSGVVLSHYPWGMEFAPNGRTPANVWQGAFPQKDEAADGFAGAAPVGSFVPNNYSLVDLTGNVAEWCADWFSSTYYAELRPDPNRAAHRNPRGPETGNDAAEPGVWKRVVRGGSWLSDAAQSRVSARGREEPGFSAQWLGFRCVRDAK